MEAKAKARYLRVTPRKARRVIDLIRGQQATEALAVLKFAEQSASDPIYKLVASGIANARVRPTRKALRSTRTNWSSPKPSWMRGRP